MYVMCLCVMLSSIILLYSMDLCTTMCHVPVPLSCVWCIPILCLMHSHIPIYLHVTTENKMRHYIQNISSSSSYYKCSSFNHILFYGLPYVGYIWSYFLWYYLITSFVFERKSKTVYFSFQHILKICTRCRFI